MSGSSFAAKGPFSVEQYIASIQRLGGSVSRPESGWQGHSDHLSEWPEPMVQGIRPGIWSRRTTEGSRSRPKRLFSSEFATHTADSARSFASGRSRHVRATVFFPPYGMHPP